MNRHDLKILMFHSKVRVSEEAAALNVSTPMFYLVLQGKAKSKRIEKHIAEKLGIPFPAIRDAWNNTDGTSEPAPEIQAMQERIINQFNLGRAV